MDKVKEEVMAKYTPQAVEEVTGVPEAEMYEVAKILAENRPGFIIWAMGQTQHTNGNAIVRASAVLMLALGNVGRSGGGCNIYRGHRSEERRVGKECRSRWWAEQCKEKGSQGRK